MTTLYTYSCGCSFDAVVKFRCGDNRICPKCGKVPIKINQIERQCTGCGRAVIAIRPEYKSRINLRRDRCDDCLKSKSGVVRYRRNKTDRASYRRRTDKKKPVEPQPLCTCCGETPKDPDLRYLCRRCYSNNGELSTAAQWCRTHRAVNERAGFYP